MKITSNQNLVLVALITFWLTGFRAQAENYWVVGSLATESMAMDEANRLSALTGESIGISNSTNSERTYHRLVISVSDFDAESRQQFENLRIEPWLISLEAPVLRVAERGKAILQDVQEEQYFLVAGSYAEVADALVAEGVLATKFINVRGETTLVEGSVYHRVLVGPIAGNEISLTRSTLVSSGFMQVGLISASEVSDYTRDYGDEEFGEVNFESTSALTEEKFTAKPIIRPEPKPVANPTGFNLARLRKKPPEMPRP